MPSDLRATQLQTEVLSTSSTSNLRATALQVETLTQLPTPQLLATALFAETLNELPLDFGVDNYSAGGISVQLTPTSSASFLPDTPYFKGEFPVIEGIVNEYYITVFVKGSPLNLRWWNIRSVRASYDEDGQFPIVGVSISAGLFRPENGVLRLVIDDASLQAAGIPLGKIFFVSIELQHRQIAQRRIRLGARPFRFYRLVTAL